MLHPTLTSASVSSAAPLSPLGVIDIEDICKLLDVSRSWIETTIRRDKSFPKPFKLGARRYVRFDDLRNWVEQRARAA